MTHFTLSYYSENLVEDLTMDSLGELENLLEVSRARNASLGVTGALLFNEGRFLQVLEGGEADVRAIYKSICADRRHTGVTLIFAGPAARRHFRRWSMAFVGMTPAARGYYRRFAAENVLERTRSSADAICELLLRLLSLDGGAGAGSGPDSKDGPAL